MNEEYIISIINAKVNEFITEISENAKYHANFIQGNVDMVIFGAKATLDIVNETIHNLITTNNS